MSDMQDLAEALFGSKRLEDSQDDPAATKTVTATALAASEGGTVAVSIGGFGGTSSIEVPTTVEVREGDTVQVTLTGDTVQTPVVTGVVGGGDRMRADVDAKAKQSDLDAANAEIAKKADKEALEAVKSEADAHAEQIGQVQQSIADFKKDVTATYATKTDVDQKTGAITKTITADYTKTADLASTAAVKDAKKAGTDAQSQLAGYKSTVSETYAEKTELTQAVNELSSTMSSNYTAFTDYRTSNDTALSKAQTAANDAQNTIDNYKAANDKAVADAKSAGTTAQNQLSSYKSANDAAVAAANKAGTDAQGNLDAYKETTDKRLTSVEKTANGAIESYSIKGVPTASNPPASKWTTDELKSQHIGDLCYDDSTGYAYRWNGTAWIHMQDSGITKALSEIQAVKTDYATKSELKSTDTELSGKISDSLATAKSYTDGSISKEVTDRNAAIQAQADQISLSVSKTYTKADTFAAYQSDADSRIATANSNAATAKSTAQTAASDAATAKTQSSTAVNTANTASSNASKAVTTANTASSNASAAVSTANGAKTTASQAASTANAASATAGQAKTAAANAQTTADSANRTAQAVDKTALKTYVFRGSAGDSKWVHVGDWASFDSRVLKLTINSGRGFNSVPSQNSTLEIFVKDGYQSTPSTSNAYAATVVREQLDRVNALVEVIATADDRCQVWVKQGYPYEDGTYSVSTTADCPWTDVCALSDTEPTGVKQDVAYLNNADDVNGYLNDYKKTVASTYATQASLKVQSDRITSEVSARAKTDKAVSDLSTRVTQTETGITTEIADRTAAINQAKSQAVSEANANTTTMIRQYSGGVLVGKTGATVGALVNAAGSFDVVKLAWSNGTPSVSKNYAQYKSVNGNTYVYGSQNLMLSAGTQDAPMNVYMTVPPASDGTESDMGMGLRCDSKNSVHAYMSTTDGFGDIADWVVARGTSGVWSWRKWSSGIAECWYHIGLDTGEWSWWNSKSYLKYAANAIPVYDYPFAFTDTPTVLQSIYNNNSLFVVPYRNVNNDFKTKSVSGWTAAVSGLMEGSKHVEVGYHAIGRWKL